jgi:hypothetical protein
MKRLDHGPDVTVLENRASVLPCSPDGNIQHGPGQVVGPNHLVVEQHPKCRVDPAQQAVTEVRFPSRLHGVDLRGPEEVNAREPSGSGKIGLNNSDGCRPAQPKFLLCQSLPQTLQPSEFVIFIAKDIENSSPTPSSTSIRGQIISGLPVICAQFRPVRLSIMFVADGTRAPSFVSPTPRENVRSS